MWAITSTDFARNFTRNREPIFVFLCDGYQTTALKWLVANWRAIHANAGPRWHMLVPSIRPINDDPELATADNYNIELALQLADSYGISDLRDPVLVLDNLDDSSKQMVLKLPKNEDHIRALIQDISKFTRAAPPRLRRADLMEWVYGELQREMTFRTIVSWSPKIASGLWKLIPKPI